MSRTTAHFIYINPKAARYLSDPEIKSMVNELAGSEDWRPFGYEMDYLDMPILAHMSENSRPFIDGISWQQYMEVASFSGIYINPMIWGLVVDKNQWSRIITKNEHFTFSARYLHIPWKEFEKLQEKYSGYEYTDKENYEMHNTVIKDIVKRLTSDYSINVETIH